LSGLAARRLIEALELAVSSTALAYTGRAEAHEHEALATGRAEATQLLVDVAEARTGPITKEKLGELRSRLRLPPFLHSQDPEDAAVKNPRELYWDVVSEPIGKELQEIARRMTHLVLELEGAMPAKTPKSSSG
jgi:hypothetical protein